MAADAPALQALFAQVISNAAWLPETARGDTDFEAASRGETVHVCTSPEGQLLGLMAFDERERFVHHLYVASGCRRRGIGRALLASLPGRDAARPAQPAAGRERGAWRLKCVVANRDARAFYAALGWAQVEQGASGQGPYLVLECRAPARAP